jgi:hypothetical protein
MALDVLAPIDDAAPAENDLQLWSVTTIIGVLDKPALLYWAAEQTALAALHQSRTWQAMLADEDGTCDHLDATRCEPLRWLRDARLRKPPGRRSATELGEAVHAAIEAYVLTGRRPEVDEEVRPFFEQFDRWAQQFGPAYEAAELTVYHPALGYAGTLDAIAVIDGVRYIVDYKTSRTSLDARGQRTKPYPEQVALQLAAYRHAQYAAVWRPRRYEKWRRRYYLLGPDERAMAAPVPTVDTGLVIHLTPDHCDAYPIRCDEQVFESYLAVQDAARWVLQESRGVMGEPLIPVRR